MKTIKILTRGGNVSVGELRRIIMAANHFGVSDIQVGNRQELLFRVDEKYLSDLNSRLSNIIYDKVEDPGIYHNIISSFPYADILPSTRWLSEGAYLEILESFDFSPVLKVSLCDPAQGMVPIINGDLNFIASEHDEYWFLKIRMPGSNKTETFPALVASTDIAELTEVLQNIILTGEKVPFSSVIDQVYAYEKWHFRVIDRELALDRPHFSYLDGFQSSGEKYWLGIFQNSNKYSIKLLEDLCIQCVSNNIGSILLSTRNSFIIKNINKKSVPDWEIILGKHGILSQHSSLDLCWTLPVGKEKFLKLKKEIISKVKDQGLRVGNLSFAITEDCHSAMASIIIENKCAIPQLNLFNSYNIWYRKDFNPFSEELIPFSGNIPKRDIASILCWLVEKHYDDLRKPVQKTKEAVRPKEKTSSDKTTGNTMYMCSCCMTLYDESLGDESASVPAGTSFKALPDNYGCSVCGSGKDKFVPADIRILSGNHVPELE
ncbi:rubredoxin [Cytophagaceae bacterium ABcell3]|nr:rubredoxin [Cytophagaceae bacterium ABcell3]